MMRVLCCGGRDYNNLQRVDEVLSWVVSNYGEIIVIEGGARGADTECRIWAKTRGIACATVYANWGRYENRAGPIRNDWMLALKPEACIAFPGGNGTADMIRKATLAGIRVTQVRP